MIMCIQNLVLIGLFVFKILSKNSILTLIKGRKSIANLPKFELMQASMYVLKIWSKNQILTSIKGRNSVANLRKTMNFITNVDLVNDYVCTKFGLNWSICFQDTEQKLNFVVNQGP